MASLPPDETTTLLRRRLATLDAELVSARAALAETTAILPRVFLVESEYSVAICQAERDWVHSMIDELETGSLSGIQQWREFHTTGVIPAEFVAMVEPIDQQEKGADEA